MNKNKIFLFLIIGIFLINFISASGLQIIGDNNYLINKTIGDNQIINFQVYNNDTIPFYNITFEDNNFIEMTTIPKLNSNETINITAIVKGNNNIEKNINIIGFYLSDLGSNYDNYDVNIDYNNGIDNCDLQLIKGDIVNWHNSVIDDIKLINSDTNQEITTILKNKNYSSTFNNPEILNYYPTRRGFKFNNICKIVVLDTNGIIHNPNFDDFLKIKIKIEYLPTIISTTFLDDYYTMNFYDSSDGVFNIKNIGNKIAKDITFKGDWFSFSNNNFDLLPGESKGIIYTISPNNITNTSDTNKTYNKEIYISGNFEDEYKNMTVFINFADVDSSNFTSSPSLTSIIDKYCKDNPGTCGSGERIIYKYKNSDDFNVSFSRSQVKEIFSFMFAQGDEIRTLSEFVKFTDSEKNNKISNLSAQVNQILGLVKETKSNSDNSNSLVIFIFVGGLFLLIFSALGVLIYHYNIKNKFKKYKIF